MVFIQYSAELEQLLILIRKMKKKLVVLAAIFLIGTLLAYPAVDIVIEDIIDRDLPDVHSETEHIAVVEYIRLETESGSGPKTAVPAGAVPRKALLTYMRFTPERPPEEMTLSLSDIQTDAAASVADRFSDAYRELAQVTLPTLFGYKTDATKIDENETASDGIKYASVTYTNFLDIENISEIDTVSVPGNESLTGRLVYTEIKDISAFYGVENKDAAVVYVKPLEVPLLKLKLSLIGGAIIALPFIFFVVGRALYDHFGDRIVIPVKKRYVAAFAAIAALSFILGTAYSYFLMAPLFIRFLYMNAASAGVQATYSIYEFVSFVGLMTFIFGLIFEFPLVTFALNRAGIVRKTWLRTYRRHIYVGFFILAAIITPPDIISQIIVAIPMIAFYEISVVLVRLFGRKETAANAF